MSSINSESQYEKHNDSQDSLAPSKLQICGSGNECVIIGGKKYYRHELYTAFAGTLQTERYAPKPVHEFANATAFGFAGFGVTTLTLGLYLVNAKGVVTQNLIVSLAMFFGGVSCFLAGVWEFFIGNTFACTAFTSYGAFWLSFGAISIPSFGIAEAYADAPDQLMNGIGFWLLGWIIFTTMLTTCVLKATVAFIVTFTLLDTTFIVLAAFYFTGNHKIQVAGGVLAIITAFCGLYVMITGIATPTNTYLRFPVIPVPILGKQKCKDV